MGARLKISQRLRRQDGLTMIELLLAMIITGIVTAMLVMAWVNLQRSSSFALGVNTERGAARDALGRIVSELRNSQPTVLPSASPSPTASPLIMVTAQPTDVQFYSAYNDSSAASDATGTAIKLTRIWLSTSNPDDTSTATTSATRTYLFWRRDTAAPIGTLTAADRTMLLAKNMANNAYSVPLFNYGQFSGSAVTWSSTVTGTSLKAIVAVQTRTVIDVNINRPPAPVDVTATVRLRNTIGN